GRTNVRSRANVERRTSTNVERRALHTNPLLHTNPTAAHKVGVTTPSGAACYRPGTLRTLFVGGPEGTLRRTECAGVAAARSFCVRPRSRAAASKVSRPPQAPRAWP